ncbi:hypothetical protein DYQ93_11390 [Xanthomonas sp. LMG 8992]|uniref:hypothetical protein n=1 Tax=Xanthomonas sp. LMG 8992 TaxID=1591157 RepID=UPI00160CDA70|nr:hypothetical protein [Xanthomonas sp. LMG 8992]MXV11623.1 hypothetical protein [Xanthomonas sp. LMG 8992]
MTTPPSHPPKSALSERQLQQRREAAAKSTGPRTEEGKARSSRNAWKHGLSSAINRAHFDNGLQSLLGAMGKPCQTTCPKYPCALVQDEITAPGGSCMDKQVYVQAFGSIIDALENKSLAGVGAMMASEIAAALQMLHDLRASIATQGHVIGIPMVDGDGNVITRRDGTEVIGKYIANPGYPMMLKTLEVLGINLPELLVTHQSQARAKVETEKVDAMQTMLGGIFQRGNAKRAPRVIEHGEGE